jgi:hypothetical protein
VITCCQWDAGGKHRDIGATAMKCPFCSSLSAYRRRTLGARALTFFERVEPRTLDVVVRTV